MGSCAGACASEKKNVLYSTKRKINTSLKFPFSPIGVLKSSWVKLEGTGTAFLIGDNFVLTCAHNVYSRQLKHYADKIQFTPGVTGQINRQATYEVLRVFVPKQYKQMKGIQYIDYDFALLILNTNQKLKNYYGFFKMNLSLTKEQVNNLKAKIYGFPQDLNRQINDSGQITYLFGDENFITQCTGKRIFYMNQTNKGQSGSPIFSGQNNQLVGIHAGKMKIRPSGIFLYDQPIKRIQGWLQRISDQLQEQEAKLNVQKKQITTEQIQQRSKSFLDNLSEKSSQLSNQNIQKELFKVNDLNQLKKKGQAYFLSNNFKKAQIYYQRFLQLYSQNDKKEKYLQQCQFVYNGLGLSYLNKKNNKLALKNFEQAQTIALANDKQMNYQYYILTLVNIGTCYADKKNRQKTTYYNQKVLEMSKNISSDKRQALIINVHNNLALLCLNSQQYEKALKQYQRAKSVSIQLWGQNNAKVCQIYNNLGHFYLKYKNNKQEAKNYIKKSIQIFQSQLKDHYNDQYAYALYLQGLILVNENSLLIGKGKLKQSYKMYKKMYGQNNQMSKKICQQIQNLSIEK